MARERESEQARNDQPRKESPSSPEETIAPPRAKESQGSSSSLHRLRREADRGLPLMKTGAHYGFTGFRSAQNDALWTPDLRSRLL